MKEVNKEIFNSNKKKWMLKIKINSNHKGSKVNIKNKSCQRYRNKNEDIYLIL